MNEFDEDHADMMCEHGNYFNQVECEECADANEIPDSGEDDELGGTDEFAAADDEAEEKSRLHRRVHSKWVMEIPGVIGPVVMEAYFNPAAVKKGVRVV